MFLAGRRSNLVKKLARKVLLFKKSSMAEIFFNKFIVFLRVHADLTAGVSLFPAKGHG